jgi:alpha-tubulin suppressor-like RCC1 family protein
VAKMNEARKTSVRPRGDTPSAGSDSPRANHHCGLSSFNPGVSRRRRRMQGALAVLFALSAMLAPRLAVAGWRGTAVAAGIYHTCALTNGGAVWCWGDNSDGQLGDGTTTGRLTPVAVSGLASGVVAVAAGADHTCAVTSGGALQCWGRNDYGQLGDGTTTARLTPATVSGLGSGVLAVAASADHTCAVTSGGAVWCWGYNVNGELGDGTTTQRLTPVAVSGLGSGVVAVAAGGPWAYSHTCAVTSGGAVQCWGYNYYGQLGDGTQTRRTTPTAVSGLSSGVVAVAAGANHTCAVTNGGAVWCWGENAYGQMGDGTNTWRWTPTAVSGMGSGVVAVTGGASHTCAVTGGGALSCWGGNFNGELGDGTQTTTRLSPVAVSGLGNGVAAVAAGGYHTCAVTSGGALRCWGNNDFGQLGDGTPASRLTPVTVSGLGSGAAAVAASSTHSCGVTSGGAAQCWGDNAYGQLGDGTRTRWLTPVTVSGLGSGVTAVAASPRHACAVTSGGAVSCWGYNYYGQLGDGTTTERLTPVGVTGLGSGVAAVATGSSHSCAVTSGGAARCWGDNAYGQLGDETWWILQRLTPGAVSGLGSGVVALSAGSSHTCAVANGGAVWCWGDNAYGQLGDGTTTRRPTPVAVSGLGSGVAAVAAGRYHTCAVTSGGALWCWGRNDYGQLGDGTTTRQLTPVAVSGLGSGVATVAAGSYHTAAVTSGGAVQCWGDNRFGQLGDGTTTRRLTPVAVSGLGSGVAAVAAGYYHTCAVDAGGAVQCWGYNYNGQLGDGTSGFRISPGRVVGFQNAAATGDMDGDGRADILWRHSALGEVWLWPMDGAARTAESYVRGVADTNWEIRGVTDLTGDGKADILWRHKTTGTIYLWPMNGTTVVSETYVATVDPAYDIVGTSDFDGDGHTDILWRHTTNGEVWIWLMDGATPLGQVYVDTVDPAYVIQGVGDLDGDGKADIVWHHATTGEVWVWLMDGTTRLSATWVGTVADVGYQIVGVADHTGDGQADILWHHATTGEVWLWTMAGATRLAETWVGTVPDTNYGVVGTGDHNGDGKADIVWRHATLGEVWMWTMDGATRVSETWVATVPDIGYRIVK